MRKGNVLVSAESTIAAVGRQARPMKTIFSCVAGSVTTMPRVTSEPVPAVVGMQTNGRVLMDGVPGTFQRRSSPPLCR